MSWTENTLLENFIFLNLLNLDNPIDVYEDIP